MSTPSGHFSSGTPTAGVNRPPVSTTTTTTAPPQKATKPKKARTPVATTTVEKKKDVDTETVTPGVVIATEVDAAIAKNLTEERDAEVEWKAGEALEKSKAAARLKATDEFKNTGNYKLTVGGNEIVIKAAHMTQSEVSRVASTLTSLLSELEVVSNKHKADSTVEVTVKKPVE